MRLRRQGKELSALRDYASRVFLQDLPLGAPEEIERAGLVEEYRAIGGSFGITERELVVELYRGLLTGRGRCGCPTCRDRVVRGE